MLRNYMQDDQIFHPEPGSSLGIGSIGAPNRTACLYPEDGGNFHFEHRDSNFGKDRLGTV